jgi:serine phosphatase RsbU (regulator of sigma subunit)
VAAGGDLDLHPTLVRQLLRVGVGDASRPPPDEVWRELLARVTASYREADDERYLLERSLDISSREMEALNQRITQERDRLEREFEIAMRIQTSILPRSLAASGYRVAARMVPADEVGGDYYDVIPTDGGCWIGIGDVTGHGLRAAVVMLMVQSIVAALVRERPAAAPRDLIGVTNRAIYANLRDRLQLAEHVTCTLLRCGLDGRIAYAGAHEDIVICRAAGGPCERLATPGTWLGGRERIEQFTVDSEIGLARGDLIVVYTDGVTEAMDRQGRQFGLDRLCDLIEDTRGAAPDRVVDRIVVAVRAWMDKQADDVTVLAAMYS